MERELNEKEKHIYSLWEEEAVMLMKGQTRMLKLEHEINTEIVKHATVREKIEKELWGDTRTSIFSKTGRDPLTSMNTAEMESAIFKNLAASALHDVNPN